MPAMTIKKSLASSQPIYGTCVAVGRRGVLIRGRSGAGKSDLALRLIADGARLVADDQVLLRRVAGKVTASAPKTLRGLIEVRGVGIVPVPTASSAALCLIVDLVSPRAVPRLPEPVFATLAGVAVPLVIVTPFEASAPLKVRLALRFGAGSTDRDRRSRSPSARTSPL
jgi:serine kinase of HPr protein (carbohydrate metabolism regulator)